MFNTNITQNITIKQLVKNCKIVLSDIKHFKYFEDKNANYININGYLSMYQKEPLLRYSRITCRYNGSSNIELEDTVPPKNDIIDLTLST